MCCWHFVHVQTDFFQPPSGSSFWQVMILLWNLMQLPIFSVLPVFIVLSYEPAFADLWDRGRSLGHSSLLGQVFTAVLMQPVNIRFITLSGLRAILSHSLYYLLWLGFAYICCCLHLLDPFPLSLSVVHMLCFSLHNHMEQLSAKPLVMSSRFWPCCFSPRASCYNGIASDSHPHCLSLVWVTHRTWISLHFSTFSTVTWWPD